MLKTAVEAARLAGRRAMKELDHVKVSLKSDNELVTQADAKCQKIIMDRIKRDYPDHGFIAEEGDGGKMFKLAPAGRQPVWWVIDPIDGTNNFAHKMLFFAVSIGVMYKDEPVVGVIYEPATDSMFSAVKGGQAQLNGKRIVASSDDIGQFVSVGLESHFDQGVPQWTCELMQRTRFRNLGSTALQLVYVANGGMVATIAGTPKLWDIAAGALIAERAGALVTNWQGDRVFPVDADTYDGHRFEVITANKKVHRKIVKMLKR